MGRKNSLTGYTMSAHLAYINTTSSQMRGHIIKGLQSGSIDPVKYIRLIGDLLAMIEKIDHNAACMRGILSDNGHAMTEDAVTTIENILKELKQ